MTKGARRESEPNLDDLSSPSLDPGHPFAKLASMRATLTSGARTVVARPGSPAWVEEIVEASHEALSLDATGRILHPSTERVVGQIVRGGSMALPDVRLVEADDLGAGARSRVQRRLLAFARDVVADLLGGASGLATGDSSAPLRAFVHRLEQGLGTALEEDLEDVLAVLGPDDRLALADCGARFGAGVVYLPRGLSAPAIDARVALTAAWFRTGRALRAPVGGAVSFAPSRGIDRRAYAAIGYPVVGPRAIRADVLDRVLDRIHGSSSTSEEPPDDAKLASWIGAPRSELRKVLASAGRRVSPEQT